MKLEPSPPPRLHSPIMEQVRMTTPPEARVLVISKGDSALLDLEGRRAGHFPQTDSGDYLGHHPADSAEAIARLETLRCRGAEYLMFPSTSFWWLEHYSDFVKYLEKVGSLVQSDPACVIYSLQRIKLKKTRQPAHVIALLATHNEERFIGNCLTHLIKQGVQVQLIDNGSTDRTVAIAEKLLGRGLLGIETIPFQGEFNLHEQLARKATLAQTREADWFLHVDADEMPTSPVPGLNLCEALSAVAARGWNVVNFQEFTFIPTAESPDHDHDDFARTMQWYYPFLPRCPWGLRAWQRQPRVELTSSGGHQLQFPGMKLCPLFFPLKHYQFLSVAQAGRKYSRRYSRAELDAGQHGGHQGWRAQFRAENFPLPPQADLRELRPGGALDATHPRLVHFADIIQQALAKQ